MAPPPEHSQHLHRDDCPAAIAVFEAVAAGRSLPGVERTDVGLWVDWDELDGSWLSSTERAAVTIARGLSVAERCGGLPPRVAPAVTAAVIEAVGGNGGARP
jgi:hypothetical protein